MSQRKTLAEKVETQLWNLICSGNGDGDTVRAVAKKIAKIAEKHQSKSEIRITAP